MLRKCSKCGRILPDDMFSTKEGYCKICRRDYDWQYRYGLCPDTYYEMYKKQDGKCKICGKILPEGQYLHVDHKKETGEIRGLLCEQCNKAIGLFHEDIEVMKQAIKYLEGNE